MEVSELKLSSQVVAKVDVASCSLGEESALLDLEHSAYFSMNPAASVIWSFIQKPASVKEISHHIGEQFETGDADVDGDVFKLLNDFHRLHLIDIVSV